MASPSDSSVKGVALITGSAQGIGRGIALRLAKDGFDIALNDIPSKSDQLRAVADEVQDMGRRASVVPADVTIEEDVERMIQSTVDQLGGLDVMVANAGIVFMASLVSTTVDDWERIMTINARGIFLCYKHAAQQMIKQGRGGRIIGASSTVGKSSTPLQAAYCASKWAIRGLTQVAALELGEHGITVNSYAPGITETPMTAGALRAGTSLDDHPTLGSAFKRFSQRPIQRYGQPEDIANLVSFLASKESSLMTGQCIAIDGGITLS